MDNRNTHFIIGLLVGLVAPVIAFYFFVNFYLKVDFEYGVKQLLRDKLITQVVTISVLADLLVTFVYYNRKEDMKMKGAIGAILLYALAIVAWELFG